jgi:hypothetical protein
MVSSIQNSINSVLYSASGANVLGAAATTSFLQSAFSPNIPEMTVTQSDGNTLSLESLVATNLASSNDYNIFSSLTGGASTSSVLASSYGSASSLGSVLSSSYGTEGTGLDLLI